MGISFSSFCLRTLSLALWNDDESFTHFRSASEWQRCTLQGRKLSATCHQWALLHVQLLPHTLSIGLQHPSPSHCHNWLCHRPATSFIESLPWLVMPQACDILHWITAMTGYATGLQHPHWITAMTGYATGLRHTSLSHCRDWLCHRPATSFIESCHNWLCHRSMTSLPSHCHNWLCHRSMHPSSNYCHKWLCHRSMTPFIESLP